MSQATLPNAVPGAIAHKLRLVRSRKLWIQVLNSLLLAFAVLLVAMGVAMLVDYLATLYDSRWRYVLTNMALAAAALTCVGWLLVVWRTGLPWSRVAGDVDREFPELEERWTTMTRLEPAAVANPNVVHPAMFRRVASEAVRWEPHVDPQDIVTLSPVVRTMFGITAITLVLAVAVVLDARQTFVLLRRFWSPGALISATELVDVPGNTVVGRGEPLVLKASLAGRPVDRATLFLATAEEERKIALVAHGSEPVEFTHNVRSVDEPFSYRFRAGDGQTEWYQVGVADRPEIESLTLTVTPPAYTRRDAKSFTRLPRHLAAIEKSELELALKPTIAVERVELLSGDKPVAALTPDADGWYRWRTTLKENLSFGPRLTESHGLTNRQSPRCEITVQADRPPAVKILTPDDQMAVRPDDTIDISFAAQDDVGIGSAELVVYGNEQQDGEPKPLLTIPIPLDEQAGARAVEGKVALDMSQFDVHDGVELSYQVRVREDRGEGSATSAAAPAPSQKAQAPSAPTEKSPTGDSPADSAKSMAESKGAAPGSESQPAKGESQTAQSNPHSAEEKAGPQAPKPGSESLASNRPTSSNEESSAPSRGGNSPGNAVSQPPAATPQPEMNQVAQASKPPGMATEGQRSAESPKSSTPRELEAARTAESDRRGLMTANPAQGDRPASDQSAGEQSMAGNQSQRASSQSAASQFNRGQPGDNQSSRSQSMAANSPSQSAANQSSPQSGKSQPSSSGQNNSSMASSPPSSNSSSPSDPPPGDSMARRSLDVPQQSASQRMRLKVDKWAGSFEGQQRAKAELAIAPRLAALDETLAKAERTAQGVLESVQADGQWRPAHDRDVTSAEKSTVRAQELIGELQSKSKGTPYAFVGLQVVDIGLAHVDPARDGLWSALESEGDARTGLVRDSRQHLVRARQLLAELRGQYEKAQREFQLAEAVERVKKMYQVYVENSMALLPTSQDDPQRFRRKLHEFDLSDEYLKRLEEVMKMREDLRAELAKILADDPRLLRRLMDSVRNRTNNLREDLSQLVAEQGEFNREVRAWRETEAADRPRIAQLLLLRQLRKAGAIAKDTGELQGRYQAWLPLERQSKDSDLAKTTETIQQLATAANELQTHAEQFISETERPKLAAAPAAAGAADPAAAPEPKAESAPEAAPEAASPSSGAAIDSLLSEGQRVYELSTRAELALQQLSVSEDDLSVATFAANRLADTRELIAESSAWVRQVKAHQAKQYARAAEVEQYRLAMKTEELAGKLGSIEQSIAGLMQRQDGTLPKPIADKAREFLATLDKEATPNQLASVYALHRDDFVKASDRQTLAQGALEKSERLYDAMVKQAIAEMDKLPVQDPVANLLDDPTLDELLAQLEQERPIADVLGIPPRPTNLRIIDDWLMGAGNLAISARSRQWMQQQMRRDNMLSQWQLDQAYRRAIARALREAKPKQKIARPKATRLSDWNKLVSQLGDDVGQGRDKAPPEQYRRAIEQYFAQISKRVAEAEKAE
ncbi:MAG: hypothetical protein AB7I57_17445 [Pirellulales bacterium]